jgi:hypothetical protein
MNPWQASFIWYPAKTKPRKKCKRDALCTAMKRGRDNRRQAVGLLTGGEAFRKEVRATKLRCLAKQDELVAFFADIYAN